MIERTVCISTLILSACAAQANDSSRGVADAFIDAFYTFEAERLNAVMASGDTRDRVLYYQGWAEGANYRILERHPCTPADAGNYVCRVTVSDDFGTPLGYTATDTFTLSIGEGLVQHAEFAGDDPPIFEEVFAWLATERPEVFAGPCKDMFAGGTTPGACAQAIAQGARDFMQETDNKQGNEE